MVPGRRLPAVRLGSAWGLALLALLVVVHFDSGTALPMSQEGPEVELLQESTTEDVLSELADAERLGSGEAAFNHLQAEAPDTQRSAQVTSSLLPTPSLVGKAAQVDLLADLEDTPRLQASRRSKASGVHQAPDMFARAMAAWDDSKKVLSERASLDNNVQAIDLATQAETQNEQQLIGDNSAAPYPLSTPTTSLPNPILQSPPAATTAQNDLGESSDLGSETDSALEDFQKEFSTTLSTPTISEPVAQKMSASPPIAPNKVESTPIVEAARKPVTPKQKPAVQNDMFFTSALADWDKEQDAPLSNVVTSTTTSPDHHNDLGESSDLGEGSDLGESGSVTPMNDLGEVDTISSDAASAQQALDKEVEGEAQKAANSVLKSTMKAVERDFLYTEKAITHRLSASKAPTLTLDDLEKAGGRDKALKDKVKAKKAYKEMTHKAKANYELSVANAHKFSEKKLANTLSGLKIKLRHQEDTILSQSNSALLKVKKKIVASIQSRTYTLMSKLHARLPSKLAAIEAKATAQAKRVAALSIQQITKGAMTMRSKLENDLGEAAGHVHGAEIKLAQADADPSQALREAVEVRTQKSKYKKLKKLAQKALVQQKAKAASKILSAQQNAKESVRMAVHDAQKKELKEAQGKMAVSEAKVRKDEEKKAQFERTQIRKMTAAKIKAAKYKFKTLVDTAVKSAPAAEKSIRLKAKLGYKKAMIAAKAYSKTIKRATEPKTIGGRRISKKMAGECIKNPKGCKMFTLSSQNVAAAAKFAEDKARVAKAAQMKAKEAVVKAMKKLQMSTTFAQQTAQRATSLEEKETRIRLAKLQLNQARAAAAFHSAAKAHLQSQLAHRKMMAQHQHVSSRMSQFNAALQEMRVTSDTDTDALLKKARATKKSAFAKAKKAAKEMVMPGLM